MAGKADFDAMELGVHKNFITDNAGRFLASKLDGWSFDLPDAIDKWILREFDTWAQQNNTTFQVHEVTVTKYWEKDREVSYLLDVTRTKYHDTPKFASISFHVEVTCGSGAIPTVLLFQLGLYEAGDLNRVFKKEAIVIKKWFDPPKTFGYNIWGAGHSYQCT
jgi:hypothetical protein